MARSDYSDADVARYYAELVTRPDVEHVHSLPTNPTEFLRNLQQQRPRAITVTIEDNGFDLWPMSFWTLKQADGKLVGFWEPYPQPFSCEDRSVPLAFFEALKGIEHIIYVGWCHRDGLDHLDQFSRFKSLTVIDIWESAIEGLPVDEWGDHVKGLQFDVRDWEHLSETERTALIWSQGPEHMEKDDAVKVLSEIHKGFDLVFVAAPNGFQGNDSGVAKEGNPYERHVSGWTKEEFEGFGYRMTHQGPRRYLVGYR